MRPPVRSEHRIADSLELAQAEKRPTFRNGPLNIASRPVFKSVIIFLSLVFVPIGVSAARYWSGEDRGGWQTADRSSAGLLPEASRHPDAVVRIYGARTLRWKSIFAIHTWIVVKEKNASSYTRYDYTAWGEPIRTNGFAPDARWFGASPETPRPAIPA